MIGEQIGPASVHLHFDTFLGKGVMIQYILPIEPMLQKLVHVFYTEKSVIPPYAKLVLLGESILVERDIRVWNHKMYLDRPLLVTYLLGNASKISNRDVVYFDQRNWCFAQHLLVEVIFYNFLTIKAKTPWSWGRMHDILSEGCKIEPRRQPIPAIAALRSKREEEFGNETSAGP